MTKSEAFDQLARTIEYETENDSTEMRLTRILGTYAGVKAVLTEDNEEDDRK